MTVAVIGTAVAVAILTDAFALPRGDDWAYRKIALDFVRTHHLHLAGWNDVTLLGQIVAAAPILALFGTSNAVLSGFGVFVGLLAAALTYAVARKALPRPDAMLVLVTLLVFPSFALLSTSFMTDTSALAAQMGCVLLGLSSLTSKNRVPLLLAAMGVGLVGFTVREFAVAAPAAVLIAHLLQRFPPSRAVFAAGFTFVAGAVSFYAWRQSLQPPVHQVALDPAAGALAVLGQAFFMLALGSLPITVLVSFTFRPRRSEIVPIFLAGVATSVLAWLLEQRSHLLLGSTVTRTGADWEGLLAGRQGILFSPPAWGLIVAAAVGSGWLLAYAATRIAARGLPPLWQDPVIRLLTIYGSLQTLLLAVRAITGGGIQDRYLWPLLVVIPVLLLRMFAGRRSVADRLLAAAPLAALALLSGVTMVDSYAFAAARWHLGQTAVRGGAAPDRIDAGFEWVGTYYRGVANDLGQPLRSTPPRAAYLVRLFPRTKNCFVVVSEPIDRRALRLISTRDYQPYGVAGRSRLFLYSNRAACPT